MAFPNNGYSSGFGAFQNTSQSSIPGRLIDREEEIKPIEIPMSGAVAFFPTNDYSCIYAKAWNSRGTFDTVKYVPENYKQPAPTSSLPITAEDIAPIPSVDNQKLDQINSRLEKIENVLLAAFQPMLQPQPQSQPPQTVTKTKTKKEVTQDE